jgi:hypothetical protein
MGWLFGWLAVLLLYSVFLQDPGPPTKTQQSLPQFAQNGGN